MARLTRKQVTTTPSLSRGTSQTASRTASKTSKTSKRTRSTATRSSTIEDTRVTKRVRTSSAIKSTPVLSAEDLAKAYTKDRLTQVEEYRQKQQQESRHFNQMPEFPVDKRNVYVFGSGSICELGLGPEVVEVKRPRLNPLLPREETGIVNVAVGGTHVLAIDYLGRVWSWGQNDSGVLGRATKENEDEVEEDWVLNSKESTPGLVENLPKSSLFVGIAATDNLSAAFDASGNLYAWGTFIDDGKKQFAKDIVIQREPKKVISISNTVALAAGKEHLLILTAQGKVYAWGVGSSNQLGLNVDTQRKFVFGPALVHGLPQIEHVAAGEFHSFAIDKEGKVYSFGLNNFGQCGFTEPLGEGAVIASATEVKFFSDNNIQIKQIACGNHHTLALSTTGEIYSFGETYMNQLGIEPSKYPESLVRDAVTGNAAYVPVPTKLTEGESDDEPSFPKNGFSYIACGTEHNIAISADDGSAWTWGNGPSYQLGQGNEEEVILPTRINNSAAKAAKMLTAGAGGQFSVLTGVPLSEQN